jgi:hypothetical protein
VPYFTWTAEESYNYQLASWSRFEIATSRTLSIRDYTESDVGIKSIHLGIESRCNFVTYGFVVHNMVQGHKPNGGACPADERNKFLRNFSIHLPNCSASHQRRPYTLHYPLREPQIAQINAGLRPTSQFMVHFEVKRSRS